MTEYTAQFVNSTKTYQAEEHSFGDHGVMLKDGMGLNASLVAFIPYDNLLTFEMGGEEIPIDSDSDQDEIQITDSKADIERDGAKAGFGTDSS